jgi:hypothetical protein
MPATQLSLNFTPGLTVQFKTLTQVCAAVVYASRGGPAGVAADLDIAPSDLSRRLNPHDGIDTRPITVEQLVGIIQSTGDMRPIHWLAEKFLTDPEVKRNQATEQIAALIPLLIELTRQAGITTTLRSAA